MPQYIIREMQHGIIQKPVRAIIISMAMPNEKLLRLSTALWTKFHPSINATAPNTIIVPTAHPISINKSAISSPSLNFSTIQKPTKHIVPNFIITHLWFYVKYFYVLLEIFFIVSLLYAWIRFLTISYLIK